MKCMPMGLIEYAAEFFANDNVRQVCPVYAGNTTYTSIAFSDFMSTLWQQTMYCHFGQKWAKLHQGPLWSVVPSVSTDPKKQNPNSCNTMQVRKLTINNSIPYCL